MQLRSEPEEEELLRDKFAANSMPIQLRTMGARATEKRTGLPDGLKSGIESLSGISMDNVKVHYNSSQPAQLNALAYAQGSDIHVAPGQEQHLPHEAWHVVQQAQGRVKPTMQMKDGVPVNDDEGLEHEADVMGARAADVIVQVAWQKARPDHVIAGNETQTKIGQAPNVQRKLEVRPPGRGEGSAFDRRQELIDRLNAQSPAIQYRLDGRLIRYNVINAAALTTFDRQMQGFIDRAELTPMRLTTGADRVGGRGGPFTPLTVDSLRAANVDLDDLMADDDFSFQSDFVHLLTERFSVRNYARRIGAEPGDTAFITDAEFQRGHRMGLGAEASLLQDFFNDPSIEFNYEEPQPNDKLLINFRSRDHGYQVFHVISRTNREISGSEMFVRARDGRRVAMDDFKKERAVAAP